MSFHIVKRDNCPLWQKALLYVAAIAIALLLGAVGYKGFVSVEMKAQEPEELRRCLTYVKEVFASV